MKGLKTPALSQSSMAIETPNGENSVVKEHRSFETWNFRP